jgi:YgiT-type zinc finger domain-containing protein
MTFETAVSNLPPVPCPRCEQAMRPATVKTAIWRGERLFVVEDIPAQICDSCMEQFYDEEITDLLRRLTEEGFSSLQPKTEIAVPIFSLDGLIRGAACAPAGAFPEDQTYADY